MQIPQIIYKTSTSSNQTTNKSGSTQTTAKNTYYKLFNLIRVNTCSIDELYDYITADDNASSKKNSKKNKGNNNSVKKKNVQNSNLNTSNQKTKASLNNNFTSKNNNLQNFCMDNIKKFCFETDKEVEEFRKKLEENSINANLIKKVKPNFSFEWIQNLPININN